MRFMPFVPFNAVLNHNHKYETQEVMKLLVMMLPEGMVLLQVEILQEVMKPLVVMQQQVMRILVVMLLEVIVILLKVMMILQEVMVVIQEAMVILLEVKLTLVVERVQVLMLAPAKTTLKLIFNHLYHLRVANLTIPTL